MRFRISGDGTRKGTRVFDADTGEELTGLVTGVTFHHEAPHLPTLILQFSHEAVAGVELVAEDTRPDRRPDTR